jgi:hypothetical protein
MSAAISILTAWDGCRVRCATLFLMATHTARRVLGVDCRRSSLPHVGWPPLPLLRTSPRKLPPTPLFPSHCLAVIRHPSLMHHPRAVRPGQKEHPITMPLLHQEPARSGILALSSSSTSTSPVAAYPDCSLTLPTPQSTSMPTPSTAARGDCAPCARWLRPAGVGRPKAEGLGWELGHGS